MQNDDSIHDYRCAKKILHFSSRCIMGRYGWGQFWKSNPSAVNVSFSMAANTQWQDMGQHNCRPSTGRHLVKVYFDKPVQGRYVKIKVDAWERHISMRAGLIVASISESKFASQGIGRLSGAFVWTPKSNMEGMYTVNFKCKKWALR